MIKAGLVSITFRALSPVALIDLATRAGLRGIEWGGDIHVPHGNLARAHEVGNQTRDAGLQVAAYGSYYRVGVSETSAEPLIFESVLETARELDAPLIRVWAGNLASAQADEAHWNRVRTDALRIAEWSARERIAVAYEYHGGTLTDSRAATQRLLKQTSHSNLGILWQPPSDATLEERLQSLQEVLPHLLNLHVFQWRQTAAGKIERCVLEEGENEWPKYFEALRASPRDHWALLEFVRDDTEAALLDDARTLRRWIESENARVSQATKSGLKVL